MPTSLSSRSPSSSSPSLTFRCRSCHTVITGPVVEVALPDPDKAPMPYSRQGVGDCPSRVGPGAFAYEPPRAAASRIRPTETWDVRALYKSLALDGVILAKADLRNTRTTTRRGRVNGCCGLDGCDGPNLECAQCGNFVATEQSDCWTAQQIALVPAAVELGPAAGD
ncbi:hypothetical protein [Streptomyces cavernicola]|uniref:Uncharacterized protein n=1 Tax=Streptomyces cavernicola TaxID=3043613 RepID=A0ABT6S6M3_9ACTN|nr:hypothetical protein [Streptomyces sp. B-S-A6]MDI3403743.1 hypothetical protein [Streptomyces sp. B-S-A6]